MTREDARRAELLTDAVCRYGGVTAKELTGKRRTEKLAAMRHLLMYMIWRDSDYTHKEVGDLFNRDRTVVHYAICRMEEIIGTPQCPRYIQDVYDILMKEKIVEQPEPQPTGA